MAYSEVRPTSAQVRLSRVISAHVAVGLPSGPNQVQSAFAMPKLVSKILKPIAAV